MYRVLVLSLEKDLERRRHITKVCNDLNLNFEFFDAKTPDDLTDYYKKEYFSNIDIFNYPKLNHDAILATFLSHLELLAKIYFEKTHTLILEDDLVPLKEFDFENIDFNSFDILQLMTEVSCCCQFVNWQSAGLIYNYLIKNKPFQAFDWELHRLRDKFNIQTVSTPVFKQSEEFVSNLAPNGY